MLELPRPTPEQQDILTAFRARQGQIEQVIERLSDPEIAPETLAGICQMALQTGQLSDCSGEAVDCPDKRSFPAPSDQRSARSVCGRSSRLAR